MTEIVMKDQRYSVINNILNSIDFFQLETLYNNIKTSSPTEPFILRFTNFIGQKQIYNNTLPDISLFTTGSNYQITLYNTKRNFSDCQSVILFLMKRVYRQYFNPEKIRSIITNRNEQMFLFFI